MTSAATFWDRLAASYAKKPVADPDAYERTLERVRAHLTPRDRVLELGCGTGTTALKLAASAGAIVATDFSAEMIAIATEKARAERVANVSFRTGTLDDAALASEPFDVVMAMNFLHLLEELPARFARIRELVRPNGLFISKTPCVGDQGLVPRVAIPLLRALGRAPYVNFVTERSLSSDLAATGFVLEETGMYPKKTRSFFIVARRVG